MKQKQKSDAFVKAKKLNGCFIISSNLGANKEDVEVWKRWAQSSQEGWDPVAAEHWRLRGVEGTQEAHGWHMAFKLSLFLSKGMCCLEPVADHHLP